MQTTRLVSAQDVSERLARGELVAFPTETVFGLGADATNETAIRRIFAAKGRPNDNPLIVHLGDAEDWRLAASELPEIARVLLSAFSPGPITVVVPKLRSLSPIVTAGLDTVGLRIPSCEITLEALRLCGRPIAAPSANRSGRPSSTTWQSVLEDLDGRIDAVLCHNPATCGLESTVVDCCGQQPVLLRPGAVTLDDLRQLFPLAQALAADAHEIDEPLGDKSDQARRSPGLRHPHYQPNATIHLLNAQVSAVVSPPNLRAEQLAYCGLNARDTLKTWKLVRVFQSLEDYAAQFYEFLREADRAGIRWIAMEQAPEVGIGIALRDRQLRASAKKTPSDEDTSEGEK